MGLVMNNWKDKCLIDGVFGIVLDYLGIALFSWGVYISIYNLIFNPFDLYQLLDFGIGIITCGYILTMLLSAIPFKLKTIKVANLYEGRIAGYCYHRRKFNIDFSDIKTVKEYQTNIIMRNIKLFHGKKKGYVIELKNGKKYYITPHLTDLEGLRKVLLSSSQYEDQKPGTGLHVGSGT